MTVVVTAEKFVHVPCLQAETIHNKVGEFLQPVFPSILPLQYLASSTVHHFPVDHPHQSFLSVIDIATVYARRNEMYGIRLEETFKEHLIACGRDSNGFH